ncbi:MAG: anaerobic glycerol-3-phosphate dehydrogenase subunit A [Desulfovibrio sp.]|nr:anaerobic glycerol-3-phosphate dehydrogenase subunit A [Desulfovibrio sp.]
MPGRFDVSTPSPERNATTVAIIGGGATGVGILRDLSMRGIPAVLLERQALAAGTSSRFHGLLHCGGRYAVGDPEAARECIQENRILRHIAPNCIESPEGFFVLTPEDDPAYEKTWLEGCAKAGIATSPVDPDEARRLEPGLSPDIKVVHRVPDASVDGFRLVWHNWLSAREHGGQLRLRHQVTGILQDGGKVAGLRVLDRNKGEEYVLNCDMVVSAAGPWAGEVAAMAGIHVDITPDRGTLVVFNHRFASRIVNRLHRSGDGDIFVPVGTVTILGTTSFTADGPEDTLPTSEEVLRLLDLGAPVFPDLRSHRILRAFAGVRPLYTPPNTAHGRGGSRNFVIVDHADQGLAGMVSIFGGKLTTYRLMAEKIGDLVAKRLGVNAPCATARTPLSPPPSRSDMEKASKIFPVSALRQAAERQGAAFPKLVKGLAEGRGAEFLCECEMVSRAEVELTAMESPAFNLNDIRVRTRIGMGTCQGAFCPLRSMGALHAAGIREDLDPRRELSRFLGERWKGLRPALWGVQVQEIELSREIYGATFNLGNSREDGETS